MHFWLRDSAKGSSRPSAWWRRWSSSTGRCSPAPTGKPAAWPPQARSRIGSITSRRRSGPPHRNPLTGWGIGRFQAVNTYHHQQWSPDTPWIRGYGIVSHENELGILAELGVIGLALWICVLALIAYRLWNAYRTLPDDDLCGKPLAVTAIMALAILICTGLTVDLRFFDFPTAAVFLLAGITIGWSDRHKRAQAAAGGDVAERVRSDMAERRALWVSTSTETRGGIATYVRAMQQTPLWTDWNIRHVATHRDGSAAAKIAAFARGALLFVVELIRFRPTVVHLHASTRAQLRPEGDPVLDQPACPRARRRAHARVRLSGVLRELAAAGPGGDPCDALPGERLRRARGGVGGPDAGDCPDRANNGNPQRGSTRTPHRPAGIGRARARGFPWPHRRSQGHIQAARRVGRTGARPGLQCGSREARQP